MKFLNNKYFLTTSAFLLGGLLTYFVNDYINLKQDIRKVSLTEPIQVNPIAKNDVHLDDQQDAFNDPFAMAKLMRARMAKFFNQGFLDDDKFINQVGFKHPDMENLKIQQSEDKDYKYIIIDGNNVDKDALKINVKNGMVSISGEVKENNTNKDENSQSESTFVSSFAQSFSVPAGVKEDKVTIDAKDHQVIIKFPKV